MNRRHAMLIAIVGAIVFAVIYFWPESASAGVTGRLHLGDAGVRVGVQLGTTDRHDGWKHDHRPNDRWKHDRWKHDRWKHDRWNHDRWKHDRWKHRPSRSWPASTRADPSPRPIFILPDPAGERVVIRETVVAPPLPAAAPAVVLPEAAPPVPLPPQGRARTVSVRGGARPREWVLGAALPPDLPHVALVPSAYGLPQPPPGQIYARVDGDVLRIEAGTRRIVAVLSR